MRLQRGLALALTVLLSLGGVPTPALGEHEEPEGVQVTQ